MDRHEGDDMNSQTVETLTRRQLLSFGFAPPLLVGRSAPALRQPPAPPYSTADAIRQALDAGVSQITLAPTVIHFNSALVLPDRPIAIDGAGMGLTELRWQGEGVHGIVSDGRSNLTGPVTVRDLTLTTTAARAGDAIRIAYNPISSSHDPSTIIERVRIRPTLGSEFVGAFRRGIVLDGGWSPQINKVWVQGKNSDITVPALQSAAMEVAIDLGTSMEAKIRAAQIACCATGVRITGPLQGKGEGFGLSESAIIHNLCSVRLEGGVYGGWPTPWASVSGSHFFYLQQGVFATGRGDVVLTGNSICGSHLIPDWGVGIYVAGECRNIRITDNHLWTTRPGQGHGIVVDASADGVISGNVIDASMAIGVWLTTSSQGWDVRVNRNKAGTPVVDQGVGNIVG